MSSPEQAIPPPSPQEPPADLGGVENLSPDLAAEFIQRESLSPDAQWTLDFLYNLGFAMYIIHRAEMREVNLEAGMEELRSMGLLDERNAAHPKVIKERLGEDFCRDLEEIPFVEREVGETGISFIWGERLSQDAMWIFEYMAVRLPVRSLRELAPMYDIDFEAGWEQLRHQGLLDESDPESPQLTIPIPRIIPQSPTYFSNKRRTSAKPGGGFGASANKL